MNIIASKPRCKPLHHAPPDTQVRNGPHKLGPNRRAEAAERRRMQRELCRAVETSTFDVMFQPRLSLATGRMLGAEALPIWPHKRLGQLSFKSFMPLADMSGLSVQIDDWSLAAACAAAAPSWPSHWRVSIPVSQRLLKQDRFVSHLTEVLKQTGLDPERLEIALDEALLGDVDVDTLLTLSAIRDLGVGVALDDFGTGFTSFSALKQLPLTTLKLHHSIIRDLPHDREDAAIVRALVSTGHALGFDIVADGIETERQRCFLQAAGCDAGQGSLFSNPRSAGQLIDWIAIT